MKGRSADESFDAATGEVRGMTMEEFAAKMHSRRMTVDGREIPNPRPAKPSVKVSRNLSMFDYHRAAVAREQERRRLMEEETPEDMADLGEDFDDDVEELSEYERADLELALQQAEARTRQSSESERLPVAPSGKEPVDKPAGNADGAPPRPHGEGNQSGNAS